MRYHDTGSKNPEHALAKWFEEVLASDVEEFRMQSGYFRIEAVRAVSGILKLCIEKNLKTYVVLGSNDNDTLHSEVRRLFVRMGMPRSEARLAIVQFSNALFHPKVYHFKRIDGSQTAYVGSANFTPSGLTGGNVEAAISLDSRDGDSIDILNQIASAIDLWVAESAHEGARQIASLDDIDNLLAAGLISENRPPRPSKRSNDERVIPSARRSKLITLPIWDEVEGEDSLQQEDQDVMPLDQSDASFGDEKLVDVIEQLSAHAKSDEVQVSELEIPTEVRQGFPEYILFEPGATTPTLGGGVMSGQKFLSPYPAVGLIMKLTRDSARHFYGGDGTANVSIPVIAINTFRFGIFQKSGRPRAQFTIWLRYSSDTLVIEREAKTNVMPYGFMPGEKGHGDLRMVMPAAVKKIAEEVKIQGDPVPKEGDFFFLEWPTPDSDSFGLTFLAEGSILKKKAAEIYQEANNNNQLIGGSSSWLPPNISPSWD